MLESCCDSCAATGKQKTLSNLPAVSEARRHDSACNQAVFSPIKEADASHKIKQISKETLACVDCFVMHNVSAWD